VAGCWTAFRTSKALQRRRSGAARRELIGRARELIPLIDRAGDRIERERRIPDDVLDALRGAAVSPLIPRSCDGEEVEPATLFEVIEAIAQGDASVGWCVGQGSGVSMTAAYVKPEVARAVFGDKRAVAACGPNNPKATAIACDGGFRLTGQWGFASGSRTRRGFWDMPPCRPTAAAALAGRQAAGAALAHIP
jgi:alkylation response protein AidB-like acyl-CoA dehydrogenase